MIFYDVFKRKNNIKIYFNDHKVLKNILNKLIIFVMT